MRQAVVDRLQVLRMERLGSAWTDGWIYGRLTEEFELQPDELEFLAKQLGFKYGWNPLLKATLDYQWKQQRPIWQGLQQVTLKSPDPLPVAEPQTPSHTKETRQQRKPTPPKSKMAKEHQPAKNLEDNLQQHLDQLHSLVGLQSVKSTVQELVDIAKVAQLQAQVGIMAPPITRHLVFTGNPGTGKTTIARLIGQIYKNLGALSEGHFTEVNRSTLVAGYVGQTAPKTTEVIQAALGGILFIDEAYALVPEGRPDPFGQEAINTLLAMMENHREDLVVIVAGYKDEMGRFIASNPGLKSRFSRSVHFADYAPAELTQIFKLQCEQHGYALQDPVLENVNQLIHAFADRTGPLGNGRFVRNIFDRCIAHQCGRLATLTQPTEEDLRTFLPGDIPTPEQLTQALL